MAAAAAVLHSSVPTSSSSLWRPAHGRELGSSGGSVDGGFHGWGEK